jgi:hypothetical protein
MKTIGHLENTGQSYYDHLTHALGVNLVLVLFAFTCIVDAFFPFLFRHFEYKRKKTVDIVYTGIIKRWYIFSLNNIDLKSRQLYAIQLSELMSIEKNHTKSKVPESAKDIEITNSYFNHIRTQLQNALEYTKCAISSTIHILFPDILIDSAPKRLIKMYLKIYYSK